MDEGNPSSIETLMLEGSHEPNLCMAELEMPLKAASVGHHGDGCPCVGDDLEQAL